MHLAEATTESYKTVLNLINLFIYKRDFPYVSSVSLNLVGSSNLEGNTTILSIWELRQSSGFQSNSF